MRREEREAAFKEAISAAQSVTNSGDLGDGGFFEVGFIASRTACVDALLELSERAAATDKEK